MIGQTLSHFRITAKLGEGGMGEVYRAEDTKLEREVAIKVLPETLTGDPERLARFGREAKVLAALNHPNIASIYQIEEAAGQQLLVMELVEGEDLAARLQRGPVPLAEAVDIAERITEGLEAAHAQGIVHRDLKPANVKIAAEGQVKILDFGLAKAHQAADSAVPDASLSPTLTAQMTQAGVILGTAAYMSPEQARGQEADPRADIWALGVLLWEMLVGERLFSEPTVSDTLAAVLRAKIDLDRLPAETPPQLRRILGRCLAREPRQRYHAAADLRIDLSESLHTEEERESTAATTGTSTRLPWLVAALASALAVVSMVAAFWPFQRVADDSAVARITTSIFPAPGVEFADDVDALALSPDGSRLAFLGVSADGQEGIWIRPLARDEVRRIPGTEGASSPFWSRNSRWLGFAQEGELKIVEIDSGLIDGVVAMGSGENMEGSWNQEGDILFTSGTEGRIMTVSQTGGAPRSVTERVQGANAYFGPSFLPDGHHFLFHERRYSSDDQIGQIRIGSLDGMPSTPLFEAYSMAHYVEPGYILWWHQGNLRAQKFDATRLELEGEPFSVVSDILWDPRKAAAGYTASENGILIYRTGGRVGASQLTWIGRNGDDLGPVGPAGSVYSPSLSPDGQRIAVDVSGDSNQGDIWVFDSASGTSTPVVTWPEDESYPVWSPDGQELAFFSSRGGGKVKIFRVDLARGGEPKLLLAHEDSNFLPRLWSTDGRSLILVREPYTQPDLAVLDLESGEVHLLLADEFETANPSLSPDGRWIAFDSNMTGRQEIYVAPYPDVSRRIRVSTEGGFAPLWSRDGTEIFFASTDLDAIFSVPIEFSVGEPHPARPTKLFSVDMKPHENRQYDTIDGQRFLVNVNVGGGARTPPTVLQNWAGGS